MYYYFLMYKGSLPLQFGDKNMKNLIHKLAGLLLVLISGAVVAAYPEKPITLVSPYGPGGAADLAARTLSATAPAYIGNSILVVNRTGAGGVVGSTFVTKARKDGYTLLLARVGSQAAVPAINRKIPYKWDDFTFLGLLEKNPFTLVVNANSPYKDFDDLKKALQAGEKLTYSSAGVGTLLHIAVVMLLNELGLDKDAMTHIPYKGGGKAAAAVIGGHVDVFFQNLSGVIGAIQSGELRALAITTSERFGALPEVPTMRELGHPDMEIVVGWSGLWGPEDLPEDVVDKWVQALQEIKQDAAWNKMTKGLGSIPTIESPADTKAFVEAQYNAFKQVTERLGLTIE